MIVIDTGIRMAPIIGPMVAPILPMPEAQPIPVDLASVGYSSGVYAYMPLQDAAKEKFTRVADKTSCSVVEDNAKRKAKTADRVMNIPVTFLRPSLSMEKMATRYPGTWPSDERITKVYIRGILKLKVL